MQFSLASPQYFSWHTYSSVIFIQKHTFFHVLYTNIHTIREIIIELESLNSRQPFSFPQSNAKVFKTCTVDFCIMYLELEFWFGFVIKDNVTYNNIFFCYYLQNSIFISCRMPTLLKYLILLPLKILNPQSVFFLFQTSV